MSLFPKIPNPFCVMWGHNFVTKGGKTYCTGCRKVVR